jgi:transposase InsO family protein
MPDADTLHAQYAHSSLFPPSHPGACDTCARAFAKRVSFHRRNTITTKRPLEVVHTDLCELNRSANGFRYLLTFIDDYTRHATIYFLKNKTKEAIFAKYLEYENHATNLHAPYCITFLQSDNGGEYVNGLMEEHLHSKGTTHRRTQAYTPQQNGVAERFNQTLVGKARAILIHSCVPNYLWQHAVNASVYLYNRTPHRTIGLQKPIARWHVESANPLPLAVFGCRGYVTNTSDKPRSKFDERGKPAIFLDYLENKKGYLMLDEATNDLIESRDVKFHQKVFPFREKRPKPDMIPESEAEDLRELEIVPVFLPASSFVSSSSPSMPVVPLAPVLAAEEAVPPVAPAGLPVVPRVVADEQDQKQDAAPPRPANPGTCMASMEKILSLSRCLQQAVLVVSCLPLPLAWPCHLHTEQSHAHTHQRFEQSSLSWVR